MHGYSALKPEQLEVNTAFVGGRDVFVVVSQLGLGKKPLLRRLPIVFDLLLGKEQIF